MSTAVDWSRWGTPTGPVATSFGPIVDYGHEHIPCPWCGTRDCLKPSKSGPLPDRRTLFFCEVNQAPAFRALIVKEEEE